MRQYSIDRVELSWFGTPLSEGLASGTVLQVARSVDTWRTKPDGHGGIVRLFSPDLSGTATIQIDAESAVHHVLVALANTDRQIKSIVGPLVMIDLESTEIVAMNKAFLLTIPNTQKSTNAAVHSWVWGFESIHISSITPTAAAV